MYRLASVLLAFGVSFGATAFAADENMTVTGSRPTPGQNPGLSGGGPSSGGQPSVAGKPCPPDGGVNCGGGGGSSPFTPAQVGGWKIGDIVEGFGTIVKLLAKSPTGQGKVSVEIRKPDGTFIKIEVEVKVTIPK